MLIYNARLRNREPDMAKVLATEIRVGNLIEWEKRIWRVLKCYHVHVGGRGVISRLRDPHAVEKSSQSRTGAALRIESRIAAPSGAHL
mgnify:CR=1 FL=1